MAEETTAVVDAPEAETTPKQSPEDTSGSPEETGKDVSEVDGKVRRANEEARKYRERAQQAEAQLVELKKAGMSEQERQQTDYEQAKTRVADLEATNTRLRVQVAALQAGVKTSLAADVPKLLDLSEVEDVSDDKQIEKAVKAFLKERQEYVGGSVDLDAGATGSHRPAGKASLGLLIRREAGINS